MYGYLVSNLKVLLQLVKSNQFDWYCGKIFFKYKPLLSFSLHRKKENIGVISFHISASRYFVLLYYFLFYNKRHYMYLFPFLNLWLESWLFKFWLTAWLTFCPSWSSCQQLHFDNLIALLITVCSFVGLVLMNMSNKKLHWTWKLVTDSHNWKCITGMRLKIFSNYICFWHMTM